MVCVWAKQGAFLAPGLLWEPRNMKHLNGTNIMLLSTFLYGVTSSKILMTFCFLFKDKYFLSFYMLQAAFQKHAGESETPAVSFQNLFEGPWAMYSLLSSRVAAGSMLCADCKGTVSSLSASPMGTWGCLVSDLWQLGHPGPTVVEASNICTTVIDKNACFSCPVRCAFILKSGKGKHLLTVENAFPCNLQSGFG